MILQNTAFVQWDEGRTSSFHLRFKCPVQYFGPQKLIQIQNSTPDLIFPKLQSFLEQKNSKRNKLTV